MSMNFEETTKTRLPTPTILLLVGATSGGKSLICSHFVLNWRHYFEESFQKLVLFHNADQAVFDSWERLLPPNVVFRKRLGNIDAERLALEDLAASVEGGHSLVVFDDQLAPILAAKASSELFESMSRLVTINSHHHNVRTSHRFLIVTTSIHLPFCRFP